jgi:hypothetical protein
MVDTLENIKFTCSTFDKDFWQVKTLYLYPDNDVIDIFIKKKEDGLLLTDLGETIRWLLNQLISDSLNDQFIADTLDIYNIQRDKGLLIKRVDDSQSLSTLFNAINELSRAIIHLTTYYPF